MLPIFTQKWIIINNDFTEKVISCEFTEKVVIWLHLASKLSNIFHIVYYMIIVNACTQFDFELQ